MPQNKAATGGAGLLRRRQAPNRRRRTNTSNLRSHGWILAPLAAAMLALGHAPFYFFWLAPIGVSLLTWLLSGTTVRGGFWLGWLAGVAYFAVSLNWIVEPFLVDPERHGWMAPFAIAFLSGGLALFWGAGFAVARLAGGTGLKAHAALVGAWTMAEFARSVLFTGFPWALPAYIWADTPVYQAARLHWPAWPDILHVVPGGAARRRDTTNSDGWPGCRLDRCCLVRRSCPTARQPALHACRASVGPAQRAAGPEMGPGPPADLFRPAGGIHRGGGGRGPRDMARGCHSLSDRKPSGFQCVHFRGCGARHEGRAWRHPRGRNRSRDPLFQLPCSARRGREYRAVLRQGAPRSVRRIPSVPGYLGKGRTARHCTERGPVCARTRPGPHDY